MKILIAILFSPAILLALLIALVRFLFEVTFVFAWDMSKGLYELFMLEFNDFMQKYK